MSDDPLGFLIRFEDGPLAGHGNVQSAAGSVDTFRLPADGVWTWPLPDRLKVLAHPEFCDNAAMWPADGDGDGLPPEIVNSRNAVIYRKAGESQMPHGTDLVARGALYRLETDD